MEHLKLTIHQLLLGTLRAMKKRLRSGEGFCLGVMFSWAAHRSLEKGVRMETMQEELFQLWRRHEEVER